MHDFEHYMQLALRCAEKAGASGEVPIGAIIVHENQVIAKAWNQPIATNDPTAHAEVVAIRQAASVLNNYRLIGATLYVTLEPCIMCIGAMIHARIDRLVYGAYDPKIGAVQRQLSLLSTPGLNHKLEFFGGILKDECASCLKAFFRARR